MGDMSAAPESGAEECQSQDRSSMCKQLESEVQELREQVKEMKAAMAVKRPEHEQRRCGAQHG